MESLCSLREVILFGWRDLVVCNGGYGMKMMERLLKVWELIVDAFVALAGILLWVQMIIVNIEVIARRSGHPTTWAMEIASLLILWIPFMVVAWVLRNDGHVKMDLIVDHISPAAQAMIWFITSLAGVVVMLIIAVAGAVTTLNWVGTKTPTMLMLPKAPTISIICIGSFMLALQFLIRAMTSLKKWKIEKKRETTASGEIGIAS